MNQLCANWKRLVAAMLAIFAALGMTACGKEEPPKKEPVDITVEDDTDTNTEDLWPGWSGMFGDEPIVLPDDVWE